MSAMEETGSTDARKKITKNEQTKQQQHPQGKKPEKKVL